ncbi:LmbE family protein [candidate division KSB3 bacterium]|uniref:LmbE family protein n=1 Tax=candidate division KSB3 bacterium TaxID=2044937 RepID=A0A9D5JXR6_9BACT|nr:LmbE family protein [candidate division KSB3 bacterium]MBD3326065.1 LmbE family protein [candidate division KSB3 bacterium]
MNTRIFALGAHPDDIEFMMGGTLLLLQQAGCEFHYMTLANGNCGTTEYSSEEIVKIRREESRQAAAYLGATYHESLVNDLEIFYTQDLIRQVTSVIRRIQPDIMLIPSPEDYMEDHMNTSRIAVTAAFCRGIPNYASFPPVAPIQQEVTLYHALPYGLTDGLRRPIQPDLYVDVTSVIDRKEAMLACHKSQKQWLDASQGLDSYLITMREMTAEVGTMSGKFEYAEGWRRHLHLGFAGQAIDPLQDLLHAYCHTPEE